MMSTKSTLSTHSYPVATVSREQRECMGELAVYDVVGTSRQYREQPSRVGHIGPEPRYMEGDALTNDAELLLQIIAAAAGVPISHYANFEVVDIPLPDGRTVRLLKAAGCRGYGLQYAEVTPGMPKVVKTKYSQKSGAASRERTAP